MPAHVLIEESSDVHRREQRDHEHIGEALEFGVHVRSVPTARRRQLNVLATLVHMQIETFRAERTRTVTALEELAVNLPKNRRAFDGDQRRPA